MKATYITCSFFCETHLPVDNDDDEEEEEEENCFPSQFFFTTGLQPQDNLKEVMVLGV